MEQTDYRNTSFALKEMIFDLTNQVLKSADDPAITNETVTNQLRELTGASVVAIYSNDEEKSSLSLNYINPVRRRESPQTSQYLVLAQETYCSPKIIRFEDAENKLVSKNSDKKDEIVYSFGIPLKYGASIIGAILVIDLPTNRGIHLVEDALSKLADVLALVVRNAFLYQKQQRLLDQSEAQIEALVNSREESIWSVDNNLNFLTFNPYFKETYKLAYNYTISIGESAVDMLSEDLKKFWKPKYENALKGQKQKFEFYETINGIKIYFEVHLNPIYVGSKIVGCSAISSNVSDRVEAEKRIRESESRFRSIFENVGHGVGLLSLEGKFIQVNERFSRITGYSKEELCQMTNKDISHPDDIFETFKSIKKVISGEREFFNEKKRLIHKSGKTIWVNLNVNSIYNAEGNIKFLTGIMHDITSELNSIKSLEDSETKYRLLANHTYDWEYWLGPDGKYQYISPSCERISGYNADSFYENPKLFLDIVHSDFRRIVETHFFDSKTNQSPDIEELEFIILHKDGSEIWISHFCSSIYDKDGNFLGRRGVNRDITERIEMIDELISAKEKAEGSDKLKSAFLANVSHEIRTPMNGILGFSSLLKESDLSSDKQNTYIDIIEKSGRRMLDTINDIIDISKIESGQAETYISKTSLNVKLDYIFEFFQPEAKSKGLKLIKNIPADEDLIIETDKKKFEDILINLVKNAIKYTETGSIEFGYSEKGEFLEFYVKDSGIGIPKERQEAVFERFVQADISLTRSYEGSGLGLSICKAYISLLGGKLWIESEPGEGSTFFFTIPFTKEMVEPNSDTTNPKQELNVLENLKILVAEDEDTSYELLEIILEAHSSMIIRAKNGIEAVEICKENEDIDLIFMDIRMPELNGYEATKRIREFNKNVVIIGQTAFALEGDKKLVLRAGCNDYISKPLIGKTVLNVMARNLSK